MLTFCARCPALVERLLASGSAQLEHFPALATEGTAFAASS